MKQPERVTELLTELRALAETDFERHRIDVLERDLTAPPVVEVVDDTHQRFDGVIYNQNNRGHYANFLPIHRAVWIYHNGKIPEGDYDIHHIDGNKANNDISNLQLLTRAEHHRVHMKTAPEREHICENCGKVFTSTSTKGHVGCCSKDCLRALSYKRRFETRTCAFCGKKFSVYKYSKTKCCSASCAAKLRQSNPLPTEKICPVCGKSFKPKNRTQTYCSKSCGLRASHARAKQSPPESTCPICGKVFALTDKPTQTCCSHSCASKLHWRKRKASQNSAQQKLF